MSSKQKQMKGAATDKNVVDTANKTVHDDNKSDSEYEYEEIEVEVDEDYDEERLNDTGSKVMISEVETIVPKEEKKSQETLVLKSDGTIKKLVQKSKVSRTSVSQDKQVKTIVNQERQAKQEKRIEQQTKMEKNEKVQKIEKTEKVETNQEKQELSDKPRLGRTLTSQEESILLPLLQGLLAANGTDLLKQENMPSQEKEPPTSNNKNSRSDLLAERNEKSESADGSNILDELSAALNRLQNTLLEEKEVVSDTRKRNTILTLVAWLKRVLQTSTVDNTEAQLFSLTELLPTELLLTKLMPKLTNGSENDNDNSNESSDGRSASSKRFSRQKNNRFNTVGVSKEELADARLYLQKKLLSENLATSATKQEKDQQAILDDSDDSRRKSLNLTDLDKDIRNIFYENKNSFSKSIDLMPSPEDVNLKLALPVTQSEQTKTFATTTTTPAASNNQSKTMSRRKLNSNINNTSTDSDDDEQYDGQRRPSNGSVNKMNKFALRKMKMKRANTIDTPKDQLPDLNSDQGFPDGNKTNIPQTKEVDKGHVPEYNVKSSSDKKFMAFLNKNSEENNSSWNPLKTTLPVQKANWSNKFGNLKNSFEHIESPQSSISPRLSKKNSFTHAPTSAFKVVQSGNKPPQVPNSVHHQYGSPHSVHNKVAAYQALDNKAYAQSKPQLRTFQSVPTYSTDDSNHHMAYRGPNMQQNNWQQNKYASVDSYMQNNTVSPNIQPKTSYNPLYVPLNSQSPANSTSPFSNHITSKPCVSTSPNEFPVYTYTSTDYTQPTCVSTFGPDTVTSPAIQTASPAFKNTSNPIMKNTILPDKSYLKSTSPPRTMPPPPLLGSSRLSKQMKTVDLYSSNEYLSEPNNYYRTPQPFSPTYDYACAPSSTSHDSQSNSGEFMATSQIMKYPQSQKATVVNKITTRYDDEQQAANLKAFLTNNDNDKRHSMYSEQSISPISEPNFSHINETYVPPPEPVRIKSNNNFVSMENISSSQNSTPIEQGAPIRLRNNTSYYGSHNVLVSNQNEFIPQKSVEKQQISNSKFEPSKSKTAPAPIKLNSSGGQYIQPKVKNYLDFSKPTYGRKPTHGTQYNGPKLNYSNSVAHQRAANYEIKRKQSLPGENTDYCESEFGQIQGGLPHGQYSPYSALKKSKSTHTMALLQQFERKGKTEEVPLPSYIRRPTFGTPEPKPFEIKSNEIIKEASKVEENTPYPPFTQESPKASQIVSKPIQQPLKPIQQESKPVLEHQSQPIAPVRSKSPSKVMPTRPKSPPKIVPTRTQSPPKVVSVKSTTPPPPSPPPQVRPRTPSPPPIRAKTPPKSTPACSSQKLEAPKITETPSSPLVEDGHIIFPGQNASTKRRVQHYAKTLNAMLNRKSIIMDDDDENEKKEKGIIRSKSGTLLQVPKQYESAIKRSEALEKERTVAAYFSGNKSPQGLQRSSSQKSVQSSTSVRTVEEQKSNTASPLDTTKSSESRTVTTKSEHHLKIMRKQQKSTSTSPNPLAKSQTLPCLLDESNVDDAFEDLFAEFNLCK